MSNNPFRQEKTFFKGGDSDNIGRHKRKALTKQEQQWGQVKFNPFAAIKAREEAPNAFFKKKTDKWGSNEKVRGKVKFNPRAARTAREQAPTAWSQMKNGMIQQQQREKNKNSVDIESNEAREFLKRRQQNFRRSLIMEKQKETTKWEDFNDDDQKVETNEVTDNRASPVPSKKKYKVQKEIASTATEGPDRNAPPMSTKTKVSKKRNSNNSKNIKCPTKAEKSMLDGIDLKNFDSKKLSSEQNNFLRKVITKCTILSKRRNTLTDTVNDLERKKYLHSLK